MSVTSPPSVPRASPHTLQALAQLEHWLLEITPSSSSLPLVEDAAVALVLSGLLSELPLVSVFVVAG